MNEDYYMGKELAQQVERLVNSSNISDRAKGFVDHMTVNCHRYLQSEFFRYILLASIKAYAESNCYDGRNESVITTARYIIEKLENAWENDRVNTVSIPKLHTYE